MTSTSHYHSTGSLMYFSTTPTTPKKPSQRKDYVSKPSSKAVAYPTFPSTPRKKDYQSAFGELSSSYGLSGHIPSLPQSSKADKQPKSKSPSFLKGLFGKS